MKKILILFFFIPVMLQAQEKSADNKGKLWAYFGLNWDAYTRSDLSLQGAGYDFSLSKLKARGEQKLSYPQYNYRLGYFVSDKVSLSVGLDHMKYIVTPNQSTRIAGRIDSASSKSHAGVFNGEAITLTDQFLHYEHTDGLNYLSLEMEYNKRLSLRADPRFSLDVLAGPGLAVLIPRTDVTLFGNRLNNNYHVSGWGASLKGGGRLNLFRHFFLQGDVKGGYVRLSDVLLTGSNKDRGRQSFGFLAAGLYGGLSVKL